MDARQDARQNSDMPEAATAAHRPMSSATLHQGDKRYQSFVGMVVLPAMTLMLPGIQQSYHPYSTYRTDDALVSGNAATAASSRSGTVLTIAVNVGDIVHAGQTVATLRQADGTVVHVLSPINGAIIFEGVTPGKVLSAGQPVAEVVDLSKLFVIAYVEKKYIKDVVIGQRVDVTVDALGRVTFHGRVRRILPDGISAQRGTPRGGYAHGSFTRTTPRVPVRIALDSYQGYTLYPGESATVVIHVT